MDPVSATAAIASIASAASAAGGAAAATGATVGLGAALGGMSTMSLISGAMSLGSMLLNAASAQQRATAEQQGLEMQARHLELQAGQDALQGQQQGLEMKKALLRTLSSNISLAGARSGVFEGSVATAQAQAISEGEAQIDTSRLNARQRALARQSQATLARAQARNSKTAGRIETAGAIIGGIGKIADKAEKLGF